MLLIQFTLLLFIGEAAADLVAGRRQVFLETHLLGPSPMTSLTSSPAGCRVGQAYWKAGAGTSHNCSLTPEMHVTETHFLELVHQQWHEPSPAQVLGGDGMAQILTAGSMNAHFSRWRRTPAFSSLVRTCSV